MHPLISASDLSQALQQDDILVLDASMALPGQTFDPQQRFANAHISGAVRFDIDTFSDPDSPPAAYHPRPDPLHTPGDRARHGQRAAHRLL
nr:hypothetical protein [Komagataeibacter rhaeticus]